MLLNNMPLITRVFALLFITLGLVFYIITGAEKLTALIPTFLGVIFLVLGFLANKEELRKHVMHTAVLLALLAFLGTAKSIITALSMLGGAEVERPYAIIEQAIMSFLCLDFVIISVMSFIQARKARQA